MSSATIIIPTLNEQDNIDPLLEGLSKIIVENCDLKVLFVDDQSKDNTIEKINAWSKRFNWISVLQRTSSPDLTQAILDGVAASKSDYILVMDADLSHPIERVPHLLKPIIDDTHDVVVGSRYTKDGGIADWPIHRRFLSWFGGLPARVLTDVKDTTSGFFACKKECFANIDKDARGYKVLLELLASGLDKFRVTETPIVFTDRILGESKLSAKQLIQYFQRLLELSGGRVSGTTTGRFIVIGILGVAIDALFFKMFLSRDWSISSAHISSFFIAATFNYTFNSIWSFKYIHDSFNSWLKKAIKYIYFGLIALTIRGGVLAILINLLNVDPSLAIYPAIIAAALVNYFGASFIVFPADKNKNFKYNSINWRVLAIATTAFVLILRFLYLGSTELIPDEAYYWNYKEHLSIGYLDHPPLIAWLIWIGTSVFGDNELGVRLFSFCCGVASLYFMFRLSLLLFDKTSAYISLLLTSIIPLTVVTGFLATTDALQITLWTASLYFIAKIVFEKSSHSWISLGICIGLGMLSKYSMALIAVSIIIFICVNEESRQWWKKPIVYLSGIIAIILFSPTLYWNAANEWASFIFQTTRRLDRSSEFSTHYLLLHLIILLSPFILLFLINTYKNLATLISNKENSLSDIKTYKQFFVIFTLIPLAVYVYFSLTHYPRFHWTAPIWLVAIPLMSHALSPTSIFINKKLFTKLTLYSAGILCLTYGGLLHYAALGLPIKSNTHISNHYFWKQAAHKIDSIERQLTQETGQRPLIIGLSKWSIASSLRFYDIDNQVNNIVSRNAVGKSATMYEQWTNPIQWQGHPVIFVAFNQQDLNDPDIAKYASKLRPAQNLNIFLNNNKLREVNFRIAEKYLAE
ncbi:MAG: glycosyltransferase family 39 protein [Gammaproteobacteria bacterium]|nr:glycosyltransferase family 39 protein [Gammaproteobacteria bacterium]